MALSLQKFAVPFEYPVVFTRDVFRTSNPDLVLALARREPWRRHRIFAVIEAELVRRWSELPAALTRYAAHHAERVELAAAPEVVEGGEAAKNDPGAPARLHARFHALGIDRQAFVLAVGGGALLDVVGYAAATAHRGIRLVRLPTTVLAQGDSGVGVKNGINAFGKKNFLGAFAPPFAVVNDARFLESLPAREARAGMAEAVKVGLIRDAEFFTWIERETSALARGDADALATLVRRSAELHLDHIATSGDPFETGSARPLDFGHWAAHKLEALSGHALRHGEAVAIGVALDTIYSADVGLLSPAAADRVLATLRGLGLPLWHDALDMVEPDGRAAVIAGLEEFREHLGGDLTVTLLAELGRGVEVHAMETPRIVRAINALRERRGPR